MSFANSRVAICQKNVAIFWHFPRYIRFREWVALHYFAFDLLGDFQAQVTQMWTNNRAGMLCF